MILMAIVEKVIGVIVLAIALFVIWCFTAYGIETGLSARYDDKEQMHRQKEAYLKRNVKKLAKRMYLNDLAKTKVNVSMRAVVVEDDLGKGKQKNV